MRRVVLAISAAFLSLAASAQWSLPTDDVPAFHQGPPPPGAAVAPVLTPEQLDAASLTLPWQHRVYGLAAHIPRVLYQLPCNCRCDRGLGHTSLLSCFQGTHGGECSTCAQEAVYAYRMSRQGRSVSQIRSGIAAHEYQSIDLMSLGPRG
jgi:hypothetical protein